MVLSTHPRTHLFMWSRWESNPLSAWLKARSKATFCYGIICFVGKCSVCRTFAYRLYFRLVVILLFYTFSTSREIRTPINGFGDRYSSHWTILVFCGTSQDRTGAKDLDFQSSALPTELRYLLHTRRDLNPQPIVRTLSETGLSRLVAPMSECIFCCGDCRNRTDLSTSSG